jgi:formyltetrahydrofolate-dependent phosphoribosylglycinamide formyltransferase
MKNIIVLISGNGSNLEAIINACKNNKINAKIDLVISNKDNAYGLVRANNNNILNIVVKYNRKIESRTAYELRLINEIEKNTNNIDLVILAGWMLLLTPVFINKFNNKIINLHPALPGKFPGINAIERAFISYKKNLIKHTGVMVHYVIEEVDAGEVIDTINVIIEPTDTLESLTEKVHYNEKKVLISAIQKIIN